MSQASNEASNDPDRQLEDLTKNAFNRLASRLGSH